MFKGIHALAGLLRKWRKEEMGKGRRQQTEDRRRRKNGKEQRVKSMGQKTANRGQRA